MTQIPTTNEWKNWISGNMFRDPSEPSLGTYAFPVMNPFPPHEWMVFKPWSDTYMVVPNDEYQKEWASKGYISRYDK